MPTNPHQKRYRALSQIDFPFVGRKGQLSFALKFLDFNNRNETEDLFVYHLWGQGGYGKSSVLRVLPREIAKRSISINPVTVNLDLDHFRPDTPAPDFLWQIRCALKQSGVKTRLYDFYYLLYFSSLRRPGQSLSIQSITEDIAAKTKALGGKLSDGPEMGWLEQLFDSETIQELAEAAGGFGKQIKAVETLATLNRLRVNRGARLKLNEEGYDLDPTDPIALQKVAANILSLDIASAISENTSTPLAIFIDGLDRVQDANLIPGKSSDSEHALERLVASFVFHPNSSVRSRICFLISGRNPLRWSEQFDDKASESTWESHIIQQRLSGLTLSDGERFINELSASADKSGNVDIGLKLRENKEHLIDLLCITDPESREKQIFPAYLGLLFEYASSGSDLDKLACLETSKTEMEERYFRSVDPNLRKLLEVFSVAGTIEEPVYAALVRSHNIAGFDINEFSRFRRLPYVSEAQYPGSIKLDDHISGYLVRALTSTPEELIRAKNIALACLEAVASTACSSTVENSSVVKKIYATRFASLLVRLSNLSLLSFPATTGPWLSFEHAFGNDTHIAATSRLDAALLMTSLLNEMDAASLRSSINTYPDSVTNADVGGAVGQLHKFLVVHKLPKEAEKVLAPLFRADLAHKFKKDDESAKSLPLESYDLNIDCIYSSSTQTGLDVAAGQLLQIWKDLHQPEHGESRYRSILLMTTARYLGDLFRHLYDFESSLEWQQIQFNISKELNNENSPELAISRMAVALALIENHRYDKAERLTNQALRVLLPEFGSHHLHVLNAELLLADLTVINGKRKDGISQMRACLIKLQESGEVDAMKLASQVESRITFIENTSPIIHTPPYWGRRR